MLNYEITNFAENYIKSGWKLIRLAVDAKQPPSGNGWVVTSSIETIKSWTYGKKC